MKEQYNTIDLMKFIFAICIVGIHSNLLNTESSMAAWLVSSLFFRTAVPFFFICSGFFLAGKIFDLQNKNLFGFLRKYYVRFIPPMIVWGGIGLVFQLFDLYKTGRSNAYLVAYAIRTIFYPRGAMWFLLAIIVGAFIVVGIYMHFKRWKMVLIIFSVITYIFLLLCNNYAFLVEGTSFETLTSLYMKVFVSARNGVFFAPMYLGIGFLIRSFLNEKNIDGKMKARRIYVGGIVSFLLLIVEASLLFNKYSLDDRSSFIFQVPFVAFFVVFCLSHNMNLKLPYNLLRRMSTSIYFMHSAIINILTHSLFKDGNQTTAVFLITVCVAIILSLISYRVKSKNLKLVLG